MLHPISTLSWARQSPSSPRKSQSVEHMLHSSLSPRERGHQAMLASVCYIMGPLEQRQAAQLTYVLSVSQASRVDWVPSVL